MVSYHNARKCYSNLMLYIHSTISAYLEGVSSGLQRNDPWAEWEESSVGKNNKGEEKKSI